jgi:exosortase/archaeosortase family protein
LRVSLLSVLENIPLAADLTIIEQVMETIRIWDLLFFIPALFILGISYRNWWKISPLLRGTGSLVFGIYWLTQVFIFLNPSHPDVVNGVISLLGFLFFVFIAWHCYLDYKWEEETKSIGWLMRTAFLTGVIYFILEHIPVTQGFLIYIVAWPTYWILKLFGHDVFIQSGFPIGMDDGLIIPSGDPSDTTIRIVFACTAALALFLFTAAIVATDTNKEEWKGWAKKELKKSKDSTSVLARSKRNSIKNILRMSDKERKFRAFLYVIPVIFVTNIFRNVGVISVTYGGIISFYDAHNVYAKILSLVMMIFLTWVLFEMLPELQEDMMGLFDLIKRVKKGMIVDGRLDLKYIEKKKTD